MKGKFEYKTPGGKLVRAEVEFNDRIEKVKITGDFFLYPEEKISEIEKALLTCSKNDAEEKITSVVENVVRKNRIEMVGIDSKAIAKVVRGAIDAVATN